MIVNHDSTSAAKTSTAQRDWLCHMGILSLKARRVGKWSDQISYNNYGNTDNAGQVLRSLPRSWRQHPATVASIGGRSGGGPPGWHPPEGDTRRKIFCGWIYKEQTAFSGKNRGDTLSCRPGWHQFLWRHCPATPTPYFSWKSCLFFVNSPTKKFLSGVTPGGCHPVGPPPPLASPLVTPLPFNAKVRIANWIWRNVH